MRFCPDLRPTLVSRHTGAGLRSPAPIRHVLPKRPRVSRYRRVLARDPSDQRRHDRRVQLIGAFLCSHRSDPFDDRAGRERAAGAHGDQRGLAVAALQLVEGGRDQAGAGRADGVSQRDGAAVDVHLVHVGVVNLRPAQHDRGEGLVDLDQVDVAQRHSRLRQHALGGLDRAVEVVVRLRADQCLGTQPGARLEAQRLGLGLVHEQDRGSTVGDLRRGARGVQAALDDRFERGERLGGGVAQALVAVDGELVAGQLALFGRLGGDDGEDLTVEAALVPGLLGQLLAAQAESVEVGRVIPRRWAMRSAASNWLGMSMDHDSGPTRSGVLADVGAQRDVAHRLDATGDADVDGVGGDQARDQVIGLLGRSALAVDGGRAGLPRQPGVQPRSAGDIVALLADLHDAAADDLLDELGVDAGALDDTTLGGARDLRRVQTRESQPLRLPIGVRAASTITGTPMCSLLSVGDVRPQN